MATGNSSAAERILSALGQSDSNVSEVVAAAAGEYAGDVRVVGSAMVSSGDRSADFVQVAAIMAHRGKLDPPRTDGSELLERLAGDMTLRLNLSKASKKANVKELKLSDTDVLQVRPSTPGELRLRLDDIDVLNTKLSDTDVLQLSRERPLLNVNLNGADYRWKLSDTDVLQLRLSDTDVLQMRLNKTAFPLRLSDTDVLQLRWSGPDESRNEDDTDVPQVPLSDTDVLQLRRSERLVSTALKVFDESGFLSSSSDVFDPHRTVAEFLSAFAEHDRDNDLLALLGALVAALPALQFVRESHEVLPALERLAAERPKTLLALARLASEPSILNALLSLVASPGSSSGGSAGEANTDEDLAA